MVSVLGKSGSVYDERKQPRSGDGGFVGCASWGEEVVYRVYRSAWSGRFLADQMDEIGYEKFAEGVQKDFGPKEQAAEPTGE